jgi:sugar lactone lactonase YvrE
MTKRRTLVAMVLTAGAAVLAAAPGASAAPAYKVVIAHSNNPRQLALGNGSLYVGEAGKAGSLCFDPETCVGFTGSIARVHHGDVSRVARGLISVGGKDGSFTVGADGVSVDPRGRVYTVFTSAGPTPPPNAPKKALRQLGNLMRVWPNGKLTKVADIDNFEFNHNPDGGPVDSDPYAVLALGHNTQIVLDAGGNDALRVHNGHVRLLAVFPSNSAGKDAVPTSLTRGPDGSILVGELGGDGSPNGASRVWRIWPNKLHQTPHVYRSGFTAVTGLAWHRHSLYVCEFTTDYPNGSPNGAVVKVTGSHRTVLGAGVLHFPGGVAVHDGHVYVSQWSVLPAFAPAGSPFGTAHGQVISLNR